MLSALRVDPSGGLAAGFAERTLLLPAAFPKGRSSFVVETPSEVVAAGGCGPNDVGWDGIGGRRVGRAVAGRRSARLVGIAVFVVEASAAAAGIVVVEVHAGNLRAR